MGKNAHTHLFIIDFSATLPLRGAKRNRKRRYWPGKQASKATGHRDTSSFLPRKLLPFSSTPFPLGTKGSALSAKSYVSWKRQHIPPIRLWFFSVDQSVANSFLRASLENCGWRVGGGSKWDPILSGTAIEAVTKNKCCQLVDSRLQDSGSRDSELHAESQGFQYIPLSPTIPGIRDLVHVFVGRIKGWDSGEKKSKYSQT